MKTGGTTQPRGDVQHERLCDLGVLRTACEERAPLSWFARNFLANRRKTVGQLTAAKFTGRVFGFTPMTSALFARVYHADFARLAPEQARKLRALLAENIDVRLLTAHFGGLVVDYGVLSRRVVTDNGVAYIVDAFQNTTELENMKFHGYGTGTNAEAQSDSALQTELTTQYAVDSTRPTGTTTEGATANIYRTVATLSPDSGGTIAITEHGVFSASSAGTLLDRSKFSAVNLVAAVDSLQTTYELTLTAGG